MVYAQFPYKYNSLQYLRYTHHPAAWYLCMGRWLRRWLCRWLRFLQHVNLRVALRNEKSRRVLWGAARTGVVQPFSGLPCLGCFGCETLVRVAKWLAVYRSQSLTRIIRHHARESGVVHGGCTVCRIVMFKYRGVIDRTNVASVIRSHSIWYTQSAALGST